jgi:hypothetical protein
MLTLGIVLNVLMVMLIHQNVQLPHQLENLLKSLISQSDPLKLLTVLINVKLVNNTLICVSLVMLTDLIHHPVTVLKDISLNSDLVNVNNVTSDVSTVMLILLKPYQIVSLVLLTELLLQLVTVITIISMFQLKLVKMVLPNVLNVPTDVLLVKVIKIIVSLVLLTDQESMIVHVLLVCMKMKTNNAKIVQIIVKLVLMKILVKPVLSTLTEIHQVNVHVFLDISNLKEFVMLVTGDV